MRTAAALAEVLPLQLIDTDSSALLTGPPQLRRRFLDWGVFHMEPAYLEHWRTLHQSLRHRNHLLRRGTISASSASELDAWSKPLVVAAEQVDRLRRRHFEAFVPVFQKLAAELGPAAHVVLEYRRGWPPDQELPALLERHLERDRRLGYTSDGPHRADLLMSFHGQGAASVLSRGEQKLVACALRLAQGAWFQQATQRYCVFLADDLPEELDRRHLRSLCTTMAAASGQVFASGIEKQTLQEAWPEDAETPRVFHVEQGTVTMEA